MTVLSICLYKAKAFNKQFTHVTPYSTNKINRHIDYTIKNLPTEEIRLTTIQVQLTISNSTNNNSTGPDGTNIRHLTTHVQHCPNTNSIPHL